MRLSLSAMRRQARLWAMIAVYAALAAVVIGASALVLAGHIQPRVREGRDPNARFDTKGYLVAYVAWPTHEPSGASPGQA
jgi:hypothetical protein